MGKRATSLTEEEKPQARALVRAAADENPDLMVAEVRVEREEEHFVLAEYTWTNGKWKLTRCMEYWPN